MTDQLRVQCSIENSDSTAQFLRFFLTPSWIFLSLFFLTVKWQKYFVFKRTNPKEERKYSKYGHTA